MTVVLAIGLRFAPAWTLLAALMLASRSVPAAPSASGHALDAPEASIVDDDAIRRAVVAELQHDSHLRQQTMTVNVGKGIVVLTGTVPVAIWRQRAQRIARVVRGVRAVVDRLVVVPVSRTDAQVARDIRRAIRATAALAGLPITVSVVDGVVELRGGISTWEQQQLAQVVASSVPGARFCNNLLSATSRIPRHGSVLEGDVRSRLNWDPLVARDPIGVQVSGTRVRLWGTVGSAAEHRRATALAWVKGVSEVDVAGLAVDEERRPNPNVRSRGLTDQEIRRTIEDLRPQWPSLAATQVEVSVLQGVVSLRGTVKTLAESQAMDALARCAVSVVAVQNQLRGPWWRPPDAAPPNRPRARPRRRPRR